MRKDVGSTVMSLIGYSQMIRLPDDGDRPLYRARDESGRSVLLERLETEYPDPETGLDSNPSEAQVAIEDARTRLVFGYLHASGLSSGKIVDGWGWETYPNPKGCFAALREARPDTVGAFLALAASLLESVRRVHHAGLLFCHPLNTHLLWNPRAGAARLVRLHRTIPRSLSALAPAPARGIGCAERWRGDRRPPDERLDILYAGVLLRELVRGLADPETEVTARIAKVVEMMTAEEPEARYQSLEGRSVVIASLVAALVALVFNRSETAEAYCPPACDALLLPALLIRDFVLYCTSAGTTRSGSQPVRRSLRRLERAARCCPENFAPLYLLARGEQARNAGRVADAKNLYEQAAEEARSNHCRYAEVIAYRKLCSTAREDGRRHIASIFADRASAALESWRREGAIRLLPFERTPETEVNVGAYAKSYLTAVDVEAAVAALKRSMEVEEFFTEPRLRTIELADYLGLTTHQLSELLNTHLQTDFTSFINASRVRFTAERIRRRDDTRLLDIAYSAGFASKTAFNAAFKRFTGMTPSQYRKGASPEPAS